MNSYEKLKLAVYESGLDFEDACQMIDIMENCDDDELEEVIEAVIKALPGDDIDYQEQQREKRDTERKLSAIKAERENLDRTSRSLHGLKLAHSALRAEVKSSAKKAKQVGKVGAAASAMSGSVLIVSLKNREKELKKYCDLLKKVTNPADQRKIEAEIDRIQKDISRIKKGIAASAAVGGAFVASGPVVNRNTAKANKAIDNYINGSERIIRDAELQNTVENLKKYQGGYFAK